MKIAVCIKRVPEMDVRFKIAPSGTSVDETGLKWDMSDFDGYAVEAALQLTEKLGNGEVVVVTVGPDAAQETLRIERVDPQGMMIAEHPAAGRAECPAAIGRHVECPAERVDAILVGGVDANLRVIEGAIVDAAVARHQGPMFAAIVRSP